MRNLVSWAKELASQRSGVVAIGLWLGLYAAAFHLGTSTSLVFWFGLVVALVITFLAITVWCYVFLFLLARQREDLDRALRPLFEMVERAKRSFLARAGRRILERFPEKLLLILRSQRDKYVSLGILATYIWPGPAVGVFDTWLAYPIGNPNSSWRSMVKPLMLVLLGCASNIVVWIGLRFGLPAELMRGIAGMLGGG